MWLRVRSPSNVMRRLSLVAAIVLAASAGVGARAAMNSGPPSGLTSNGRVLWNLDALLNDTFGNRVPCYDDQRIEIFSVSHGAYCPSPSARYQPWEFTFLNAFHSEFRLVRLAKAPDTGATNSPVRVGNNQYVSCPGGEYHNGGRGWIVIGGGAGPTGLFWCN